jgi:hypothetical protein
MDLKIKAHSFALDTQMRMEEAETAPSLVHEAKSLLPPTPEAQREFAMALHKPNGP